MEEVSRIGRKTKKSTWARLCVEETKARRRTQQIENR